MKLKETNITARTAWSPRHVMPIYLAAGSAAQQLDASFNSDSQLKLYDLNANECTLDLKLVATKTVPSKFHQLLWKGDTEGILGQKSGVIVGGCEDESIYIYSADKLIKKTDPLLLHLNGKHGGPVYTIDFNHHQKNLLASGSKNCEILIWDVNHPKDPMTPFTKPNLSVDVTSVAWNCQVENIMAATYSGCCIVYDLKKSASIVQISESVSRLKSHGVRWHPSVATQMIIWSADDHTPVAQLWDLRFAASPVSSLEGHQRGIAAAQWCPDDSDLFITCGKDNKVLIWNPNCPGKHGEIVGEFPAYNQWSFDISWCRRDPSLVATSSIDASVSVYSLMGAGLPPNQTSKFSAIADSFPGMELPQEAPQQVNAIPIHLKKPPKWFISKCGASFGFGGKLVSWSQENRSLTISQVITEQQLVANSQMLEQSLAQPDLRQYCEHKVSVSIMDTDKEIWRFIEASFDSNPRLQFSHLLGFNPDAVARKVRPHTLAVDANSVADKISDLSLNKKPESSSGSLDPSEQFELIAATNSNKTPEILEPNDMALENLSLKIGDDPFGMLRNALIVGDFESAVEICLTESQNSLALILAAEAGGDIFLKTQQKVLRNDSLCGVSALVGGIVNRDFEDIVTACELKEWKPALVAILTYADDKELTEFSGILGNRLERNGNREYLQAALLCYVCAGNVDQFAGCFKKSRPTIDSTPNALQDLVEYLVMLQKALKACGRSFVLEEKGQATRSLSRYSSILASQGALNTALSYISSCSKKEMTTLQERISAALGYGRATGTSRSGRLRSTSNSSQHSLRRASTPHSYKQTQFQPVLPVQPAARSQPIHQPCFVPQPPAPVQPMGTMFDQQPSFYPSAASAASQPPPMDANTNLHIKPSRYVSASSSQNINSVMPLNTAHTAGFTPQGTMYAPQQPPVYGCSSVQNIQPTFQQVTPNPYCDTAYESGMPPPAAFDPSVPRGWNDPPTISSIRKLLYYEGDNRALSICGHSGEKRLTALKQKLASSKLSEPVQPIQGMMIPEVQQVQQFSRFPPTIGGASFGRSPSEPMQRPPSQPAVAQPLVKQPIPTEHLAIQNVFDTLRETALLSTVNPQAKQRLEDVGPKLELLYDKLRSRQVGKSTTDGLHKIVGAVRDGDYHQALLTHSATISSGNFSEMATFMPALKTLLSTCMQGQIFLH